MSITLLSDTFTDADNTALTAHTMDVGPGWTAVAGTFKVLSNKATLNSAADGDRTVSDSGKADVQVDCDMVPQSGSGWESSPQMIIRFADDSNHWVVHITSSGGQIILYEKSGGGAYTQRASASFSFIAGNTYAISIVCQGATIAAYVGGVLQFSYASATSSQTATKAGFRNGQNGSIVTKCTWDNFKVRELVQFDAASNSGYQAAVSSLSWAHNWQGSNRALSINVAMLSVTGAVTAMTYGGANCTFIGAQNVVGGTGRVEMWRICQNDASAPAVGSNTISVTLSGSMACAGMATSRANVNQAAPTESFAGNSGINAGSGTNATIAVTSITTDTVMEFALATSQNSGITASGVSRNVVAGTLGTGAEQDSGQITSPSTYTGTWTGEGVTAVWACAGYAIRPAGAAAELLPYLDLENPRIQDKIQLIPR